MGIDINLRAIEATPQTFDRFGAVVTTEGCNPVFESPEFDFFGRLASTSFGESVAFGMVVARPGPMVSMVFERHRNTPELIAPLTGTVAVVLGEKGDAPPDDSGFSAFIVKPGRALIIAPGVWHFAPLASSSTVSILIGFREGTPNDDVEVHNLGEERGVRFQVSVPAGGDGAQ